MHENRTLIRGDNLEAMRKFPDESVDLIATERVLLNGRGAPAPTSDL